MAGPWEREIAGQALEGGSGLSSAWQWGLVGFFPESRLACVILFSMVRLCWLACVGSGDSGVLTSWNQSDMHLTSGAVHRRTYESLV